MTRHHTSESSCTKQKQIKPNKSTKPNKYLKNKSNTFSFEDPHLEKFFQQPSKKFLILHDDDADDDDENQFNHQVMDSEANIDDFYDEISSTTSETTISTITKSNDSIVMDSQSSLNDVKLNLNLKFNENDTYRIGSIYIY